MNAWIQSKAATFLGSVANVTRCPVEEPSAEPAAEDPRPPSRVLGQEPDLRQAPGRRVAPRQPARVVVKLGERARGPVGIEPRLAEQRLVPVERHDRRGAYPGVDVPPVRADAGVHRVVPRQPLGVGHAVAADEVVQGLEGLGVGERRDVLLVQAGDVRGVAPGGRHERPAVGVRDRVVVDHDPVLRAVEAVDDRLVRLRLEPDPLLPVDHVDRRRRVEREHGRQEQRDTGLVFEVQSDGRARGLASGGGAESPAPPRAAGARQVDLPLIGAFFDQILENPARRPKLAPWKWRSKCPRRCR